MSEIDSTSNERIVNNVMRHQYRVLTEDEKSAMSMVKDIGLAFLQACDTIAEDLGPSRELAVAKTRAEEAVMWAVKAITR